MLFLEKGHACAFRTTFVVEGELSCTAASMVNGKEALRLPLVEGPPIPRAMELKTTSPINAIARANARRRLLDATRSVGPMRAALCEGIGSPAKANYDVPLTPHGTGSEKGEPREFPEFRNGSMDLKLTVSERSPASKCTRGCTAQSVRRISCVPGRWTTWFEMRGNPPTRLGKLKARGFLQGDGGETGAGTHDPVDPRPPVVLGHRPPRRAE